MITGNTLTTAAMTTTKFWTFVGIACVAFAVFGRSNQVEAGRSNGLIRRCGNDAREFLRWFCVDPTFDFPFPFHRVYIILRYRPPFKELYPFQHQASVCCRFGCTETAYERMCRYHKKLQFCAKKRHHRTRKGRGRRLEPACRLTRTIS